MWCAVGVLDAAVEAADLKTKGHNVDDAALRLATEVHDCCLVYPLF